jgi:muramoyltetrapeptide carboxypeptidase
MTTPPFLKPNDKVGVIATAKRTEREEIEAGIQTLKSWGLIPIIGANAFKTDGFLAGTDDQRAADLQFMLDEPEIRAIFFTKGGYGTLRIIDRIDWTKFRQNPKWLVGYSDITLLHSHVHNFGLQSLHAVMLQGYAKSSPESLESVRSILFGEKLTYTIPAAPDNRVGAAVSGQLVGGNLSMLYAIIGSESDIDTTGKILFIEDIDEYLYHYDRMLLSLKRAGKLAGLKAIIVGKMIDIKESTIPFGRNERQMTLAHTAEYGYPVIFDFPAGHVTDNRALLLGAEVDIVAGNGAVTIAFLQ